MITDSENDFVTSAKVSLERDQKRRGGSLIAAMSVTDRLTQALQILEEDALYQKEYEQFVTSMSYATEDELISFGEAVQTLGRIITVYSQ
jgi:hypothetical protein